MAGKKFGGGVKDQIGAQLNGSHEIGRRESRVHQQGQTFGVCNLRQPGDVQHFEPWIAEGLAEQKLRVWADGITERIEIPGIDESGFDPEAGEGVLQKVVGAAVEGGGRY